MEESVTFTLHVHEQSASGDSDTTAQGMAEAYADQGFDFVGFVGHDQRPEIDDTGLPVNTMTGTEMEIRTEPTRLHILEFPDQDLTILAHPKVTWPTETEENAIRTAEEYDVDAIELFSRGEQHLPEPSNDGFARVANDDAHSTLQTGGSYMTTMVDSPTPDAIARRVKQGQVELHNPGLGPFRYYASRLHQGLALIQHRLE